MFDKKGQGATEYLLMLAAVLVIVAAAIYYVTSTGGYPAVAATAAPGSGENEIAIEVQTGSIAAGEWQYAIENSDGVDPTWTDGTESLDSPSVTINSNWTESSSAYVSLRHKDTGHIYFSDQAVAVS